MPSFKYEIGREIIIEDLSVVKIVSRKEINGQVFYNVKDVYTNIVSEISESEVVDALME